MKTKIEKFYQTHKDEVIVALGSMTAFAVVVAVAYKNQADGKTIIGGGMIPESNDNVFCVATKNGRHHHFTRPEEK